MKRSSTLLRAGLLSLAMAATLATSAQGAFIEVTSAITQDTRWTRNNVYILRDVIYVLPPARLTIEPGTLVRGVPGELSTSGTGNPGSLVITRGAKIIANATPDDPIIMTSLADPYVPGGSSTIPPLASLTGVSSANYATFVTNKNYSAAGPTGNNLFVHSGEWGGLILLGQAPIGYDADTDTSILQYNPANPAATAYSGDTIAYPNGSSSVAGSRDVKGGNGVGIALIEGLTLTPITMGASNSYTDPFKTAGYAVQNDPDPSNTNKNIIGGVYGGLNQDDNSGVLRFVSARFGGNKIGADNEINGITFGGVGRGTVVEWNESFNNKDDSFEFFGGYFNPRYLFSLFNGDDGMDGDQGFNGNLQNLLVLQNNLGTRSGFGNDTATGRDSLDFGDACAEWDGAEDQTLAVTPNTKPNVANFTFIGEGNSAVTQANNGRGIRNRRAGNGLWMNGVIQDTLLRRVEAGSDSGTDFKVRGIVGFNTGSDSAGPVTGMYLDGGATIDTASPVRGNAHLTKDGFDPRLRSGSPAADLIWELPNLRTDAYAYSGWTPLPYAGGMRDNLMLNGWSIADWIELIPASNIQRPAVTIRKSGNNASVSFAATAGIGGRAALYVLESSSDMRSWKPVGVVADNQTGFNQTALTAKGYNIVSTDSNATAGQITVIDSVNGALAAGTPRYYRVIPQ
jgi:hypothetical protein